MSDADYKFITEEEYLKIITPGSNHECADINKLLNDKCHRQLYTPANGGFGSEDTSLMNRKSHTHVRFVFTKEIKPEVECDHTIKGDDLQRLDKLSVQRWVEGIVECPKCLKPKPLI